MSNRRTQTAASESEGIYEKYRMGMRIILEGARAETGQTPKEVIWAKNKARLYRYKAATERRFPVPVLLVYALINRSYVLDLLPGNSLVEYLVGQGFDVYLLDWGTPGDEDQGLTFEHYVLDYLHRAVSKVLKTSRSREFTLLGYCMGGTISAMYAALFPGSPLRNLLLLLPRQIWDSMACGPARNISIPISWWRLSAISPRNWSIWAIAWSSQLRILLALI
jgi:polyhydroxyalkanoate synthase